MLVAGGMWVVVGAVPNMGRNAVESGRQYRSSDAVTFQRRQTHARCPRFVRAATTAAISGVIPAAAAGTAVAAAEEEEEEEWKEDKEIEFAGDMDREMEGGEAIKPT